MPCDDDDDYRAVSNIQFVMLSCPKWANKEQLVHKSLVYLLFVFKVTVKHGCVSEEQLTENGWMTVEQVQ